MNSDRLKKMIGQLVRLRPPAVSHTFSPAGEQVDIEWCVQSVQEKPYKAVELRDPGGGLVFTLGLDNMQDFRSSGHFMLKCQIIIRGNEIAFEPLPDARALSSGPAPPSSLSAVIDLAYTTRAVSQERHAYRLPVAVTNTGDEILADWTIEVRFPRRLLEPQLSYPIVRTEATNVIMRRVEADHSGPIYPGERREILGIDYYVDIALYEERAQLFGEEVVATFYVGTKRVAQTARLVRDLQRF